MLFSRRPFENILIKNCILIRIRAFCCPGYCDTFVLRALSIRFEAQDSWLGVYSWAASNTHRVDNNIFSTDMTIMSSSWRMASILDAHIYDIYAVIDGAGGPVPCVILAPAGHRLPGVSCHRSIQPELIKQLISIRIVSISRPNDCRACCYRTFLIRRQTLGRRRLVQGICRHRLDRF